jgi:large subunit ribosomal protein L22
MAENEKKKKGKKGEAPAAEAAPAEKVELPPKRARAKDVQRAAAKVAQGPSARLSFLRMAPRKVRLVADNVRGLPVGDALASLKFTPNAAAKPLAKLLRSAVANAESKGGHVDVDRLYVKTLTVDGGPKMRRFMARAMGRAFRIEKRTSHVYVELGTGARA